MRESTLDEVGHAKAHPTSTVVSGRPDGSKSCRPSLIRHPAAAGPATHSRAVYDPGDTRAALNTAIEMVRTGIQDHHIVTQIVPFPLPLDDPPVPLDRPVNRSPAGGVSFGRTDCRATSTSAEIPSKRFFAICQRIPDRYRVRRAGLLVNRNVLPEHLAQRARSDTGESRVRRNSCLL